MIFRPQFYILPVLAVLVLAGCGAEKKAEPAEVQELVMYTDGTMNFGIKYPSNWQKAIATGSQAAFYSDNSVVNRFIAYDAEGPAGAKVQVVVKPLAGTLDEAAEAEKAPFASDVYSAAENTTVAGVPGKKISYGFDLGDGKFMGEKYIAAKDSFLTVVSFEAFGGTYDALRPKFEEMLQSVQLAYRAEAPAVDTTTAASTTPADTFKPSPTTRVYKGNGFTIDIPDNFSGAPASAKGALSATRFKGVGGPADCTIQVDVLDASKQKNLDKIAEQNKDVYKTSPVQTTVGGQKAYYFNYSLRGDAGSRAYFVVRGDKLYRITLNWYKPEQSLYLPAFEKAIASFKFV